VFSKKKYREKQLISDKYLHQLLMTYEKHLLSVFFGGFGTEMFCIPYARLLYSKIYQYNNFVTIIVINFVHNFLRQARQKAGGEEMANVVETDMLTRAYSLS